MTAANEDVDELKVKLDEYGFVVVEDLLDGDAVHHLAESISPVFDERVSADEPNQHIRGLIGVPRDVGRLAIFLASEDSRYVVGKMILLDVGQSLVMPLADRISDLFGGTPPSRPE